MKNTILKAGFLFAVSFVLLSSGTAAFAQVAPQVQTNSATNIQNNSATLNANLTNVGSYGSATVYFQWGADTSYGNQTSNATQNYTGTFNQLVSGLSYNTTYHFRAVAQNSYGTVYGQDMTFYSNSGNNNYNSGSNYTQTNSATNISNYQATLNGYLYTNNLYSSNYVYFQWGTTTSYGSQTSQQYLSNAGFFTQNITGLSGNTTYHFRAVAQGGFGTIYGQDMTFYTSGYASGNGTLAITKQVINLTSGNLNWQPSVGAKPGDILSFAITMQADGQDVHNIVVSDILPSGLIYKGNMTVNATLNYGGNPASGINIGTIPANGVEIISFQAQVAPATSLAYGVSTIINNATITSTEAGTQTSSASVIVSNSLISGASIIATGITNNPVRDSFFLPLALIILMSWLYFTGRVYTFADWLGTKM